MKVAARWYAAIKRAGLTNELPSGRKGRVRWGALSGSFVCVRSRFPRGHSFAPPLSPLGRASLRSLEKQSPVHLPESRDWLSFSRWTARQDHDSAGVIKASHWFLAKCEIIEMLKYKSKRYQCFYCSALGYLPKQITQRCKKLLADVQEVFYFGHF